MHARSANAEHEEESPMSKERRSRINATNFGLRNRLLRLFIIHKLDEGSLMIIIFFISFTGERALPGH